MAFSNPSNDPEGVDPASSVRASLVLRAAVCRIAERGDSSLVDGVFARVPLGVFALLLEFGEFPAIVDGRQKLPDEQESQADQDDAQDHSEDDGQDVDGLCTFLVLCTDAVASLADIVRLSGSGERWT